MVKRIDARQPLASRRSPAKAPGLPPKRAPQRPHLGALRSERYLGFEWVAPTKSPTGELQILAQTASGADTFVVVGDQVLDARREALDHRATEALLLEIAFLASTAPASASTLAEPQWVRTYNSLVRAQKRRAMDPLLQADLP